MIKALKMIFLVITRVPVMNIKSITFKYRLKRLHRLYKVGYLNEEQSIKIADRLNDRISDSDKVFDETVRKYLNERGKK